MSSKQTYYLKNIEEQKLKSLRRYYVKQLENPNLETNRKTKYETKLQELNDKIDSIESNHKSKSKPKNNNNNTEDRNLKSLRNYYIKQLRNPELEESKKTKYENKLAELNDKINNIEDNEITLEELLEDKASYEAKLNSIEELKIKYEAKLQEIVMRKLKGLIMKINLLFIFIFISLKMQNLEDLTRKQLYKIYLAEVDDVNALAELAKMNQLDFDTKKLIASRRNITQKTLDKRLESFKDDIINDIIAAREIRREAQAKGEAEGEREREAIPAPMISAAEAKANLKRYDQTEEYKSNQLKLAEQRKLIEKQQAEIEANRKIIEDLRKQIPTTYDEFKSKHDNKINTSKLIVEGIPTRIPKAPAINEIPAVPVPPLTEPDGIVLPNYGASKEFKQTHHGLTFEEYRKLSKNSDSKLNDMIKYLESDRDEWFIDFTQFNSLSLSQIQPHLLQWFEEKIGKLNLNDRYLFSFKVNGAWHSKVMTPEVFEQLQDSLTNNSLIYDMEKMPTFEYESGNKIDILPEWSLYDAIRIYKRKHYNNVNRDNGGHFFPYLNNYTKVQALNDYFKRLQIFSQLNSESNPKKMRPELEDCCFLYALKQTEQFFEEELNLMRLRIKSRYLSQKAIQALCLEFHIKVKVHVVDFDEDGNLKDINNVRVTGKDGKTKNHFGEPDTDEDRTFEFNLFKEHYFIEERTPFTSDFIKRINSTSENNYNKMFKNSKWYKAEKSRFITSSNLVIKWFKQNKFTPINFATAAILKTELYDKVKDEEYPLEFDEQTCVKKIEPKKPKQNAEKVVNPYWYA
ncbi:MAG: hypothetical protein IKN46_02405, partial [Acholeplasmatales bacterium]|nr:hypothetical protein [Acholeplasmatales bacterium]